MQEQVSRQFVGIDLHRRGSVIVRLDQAGNVLGTVRVENDPVEFALAVAEAGEGPEVTAHQIEFGCRRAPSGSPRGRCVFASVLQPGRCRRWARTGG